MKKPILLLAFLGCSLMLTSSFSTRERKVKRECQCSINITEKGGQYCKWNITCYVGPSKACEFKNQSASCNKDRAANELKALCDCDD